MRRHAISVVRATGLVVRTQYDLMFNRRCRHWPAFGDQEHSENSVSMDPWRGACSDIQSPWCIKCQPR